MLWSKKKEKNYKEILEDILNDFERIYKRLVKLETKVEALEDKYNVLRASLGSLKAKEKKNNWIEALPPNVLEQLGYRVIRINRSQSQSDTTKKE